MKISRIIAVIASFVIIAGVVIGVQFSNGGFGSASGGNEASTNKAIEEVATHEDEQNKDDGSKQDDTESVSDESADDKTTTTTKKRIPPTTNKTQPTTTKPTTTKATTTKPTTTKPTTTKKQTTATTTKVSSGSRVEGFESEMLTIINEYRAEVGVAPLSTTTALNNAAAKRAEELIEVFEHTRPDGSSCFTVLDEYAISYRTAGENIAWGQRTVSSVMTSWYNSEGHKTNMQNASFGHVGFGCYNYNGRLYWVQLFTN